MPEPDAKIYTKTIWRLQWPVALAMAFGQRRSGVAQGSCLVNHPIRKVELKLDLSH